MLEIRRMTPRDIPDGLRLREQAGWNQTADDWGRLLAWEPDGCFVGEITDPAGRRVVASATTTVYSPALDLAWIGMVLVDSDYRSRGMGRALVRHAMAYLDGRGVSTIGLDATPVAKAMYDRLGYRDAYVLERRVGHARAPPDDGATAETAAEPDRKRIVGDTAARSEPEIEGVRPLRPDDLPAVAAFDARASGTERARILGALYAGHPGGCFVAERGGTLRGYLLSRPGTRARHLGPLVAADGGTTEHLVRAARRRRPNEPIVMDVVLGNRQAVALADRLGLEPLRPFIRMTRGAPPPPADLDAIYTSAAPEIG